MWQPSFGPGRKVVVGVAGRKLVIVESPAKIKSISAYLGPEFDVEASMGTSGTSRRPRRCRRRSRRVPFGKFGVDVDNDFEPYYIVDADKKKKKVAELKRLLKNADELYLATDEDRERGDRLAPCSRRSGRRSRSKRMVFNEITRDTPSNAPRQHPPDRYPRGRPGTRRIPSDRGSMAGRGEPVLWRARSARGLSAGRVQSVATRMVVERERERMAFRAASQLGRRADFATTAGEEFTARLTALDEHRVATGRDFDDRGVLTHAKAVQLDQAGARLVADSIAQVPVRVTSVQDKFYTRRPSAPFITSIAAGGGLPQTADVGQGVDARGAAALRERLHHLYAHRLHGCRAGRGSAARARRGRCMRGLRSRRTAPLPLPQ